MKTQFNSLTLLAVALLIGVAAPGARAQNAWKMAPVSLQTRWAKEVSPSNALPAYPRPQMTRASWQSLNGLWSYGLTDSAANAAPAAMNARILVPFPYESALSGVGQPSIPAQKLWYKRRFTVPAAWKGGRVLLHFGAVNYDSTVTLNGQSLGAHRGGYDEFSFDITPQLKPGENELIVSANNPLKADVADAQVLGKQRVNANGIFYTGATGIWQSVWLEPVPAARIDSLRITPDVDASSLRVTVNAMGAAPGAPVKITVFDGGKVVATQNGVANGEIVIPIANPKLWSPETPQIYDLTVTMGTDSVGSYAAMRKISLVKDAQGRTSLGLNNKPYFQVGALDQGYWPDGIYTAPTDDALKFDIVAAKSLGWNLLRKHAKVEPARWYYWTDRLGMLVWQDMPSMFGGPEGALTDGAKTQFDTEWREIIRENYNHPSIVVWTTFNEGWGQHDTDRVVAETRQWDGSRLVNDASGWVDKNVGDLHDTHAYPGPWSDEPEATRAAVNGEFGGVTADLGHRWQNKAGVMGYGTTLSSSWLATKRFQNLMRNAYKIERDRGTSAVVYTQLTDVEQEINGALTYDRAVVKLDPKIVAAANRGEFLPLPPNPNPDLVPTSDDEPLQWQYTTEKPADNWFAPGFNAAAWQTGAAPFGNDMSGVRTPWKTSDIWIRRQFTLPDAIPAQLNLLVKHDEDAEIYLNGVLAATLPGYDGDYKVVPMSEAARATLKPGANTWAIHVHQTVGGQGIDVGIAEAK